MKIDFPHRQFAHCESGVTANLLNHHGFPCSEAMAFGIGSGLFFAYIPFVKINHLPLTTFRTSPGSIFKKVSKRLGIAIQRERFRDEDRAEQRLDQLLTAGHPVGAQTGVYWLPFFPPAYRFHFNAHNLVIIGKENNDYLISDPIFEETVRCPAQDLRMARFSKGALAPKGKIYYIKHMPAEFDLPLAIEAGIKDVCRIMLKVPVPLLGIRGMHLLAKHLIRWPIQYGEKRAILHLGHLIRMQEEIGTGGAGFRFIYAAFLEEAAAVLQNKAISELSVRCTHMGDRWREFALNASRACKRKDASQQTFKDLSFFLQSCAQLEEQFFSDLLIAVNSPTFRQS